MLASAVPNMTRPDPADRSDVRVLIADDEPLEGRECVSSCAPTGTRTSWPRQAADKMP